MLDVSSVSASSLDEVRLVDAASSVNPARIDGPQRVVPRIVNRSQAYYWTSVWQRDVERSRDAIAAGDYRDFDDASDLVRWLLSDGD